MNDESIIKSKILAGVFLAMIFALAGFVVFAQGAFAQVADTCPGNDPFNAYTCQTDYYLNCADVYGAQQRTVNCYSTANDVYGAWQSISCGSGCGTDLICDTSTNTCVDPTPPLCPAFGREWTMSYKPSLGGAAYGYGTAVDSAGNIYETGEALNASNAVSGLDVFVRKYDSNSGLLWERVYDNGGNESGYGIVVDAADANIYITGRTDVNDGNMLLLKYDSSGAFQWDRSYDYVGGADIGRGVAFDGAGYAYIAGNRQNSAGDTDAVIWRADANGSISVMATYDNGGRNESANAIVVNSGYAYVTGYHQPTVSNTDMFLNKYSVSSGLLNWTKTYDALQNGGGNFTTSARGCLDHSVGLIYETNGTKARIYMADAPDSFGGWFTKCTAAPYWTTSSGKTLFFEWDWNSVSQSINSLTATIQGTCNRACFGTTTFTRTTPNDTRFDPNSDCCDASDNITATLQLAVQWNGLVSGLGTVTDIGRGVTVNSNGNVFIVGYQDTNGGDAFTAQYDANGNFIKGDIYNSSGNQADVGRSVSASGRRAFITGSQQSNGGDMFLRVSDITTPIVKLYKGGVSFTQEMGYGIAQNSGGDAYVAGYQDSNGGEAFLSKYSCNAPMGEGVISNGYFTVSPAVIFTGMPVTVDATKSGAGITKYEWDWGDPADTTVGLGVVSTHAYNAANRYQISLRITGGQYDGQTVTQWITVLYNNPPSASFTLSPLSGATPLVATVNASSSDPGNSGGDKAQGDYIKSFSWDWGDGTPKGQGEKTTHFYSSPGIYTITLTVTDLGGLSNTTTRQVTVTQQYVCDPTCVGNTPICGPDNAGTANQCYQCLSDTNCGSGYRCLGVSCKSGQMCSDGITECPADGRCPEATSCKVGDTCPDGSACPASGICYSAANKNTCVLSSDTQMAQCYTEVIAAGTPSGLCATDLDCAASLQGGTCDTATGQCRYARCLNETDFSCTSDKNCNNADGICFNGACDYVYDCAYGPGMNTGATTTIAILAPAMPKMPIGVQSNGQACTKPTPDAPNNCEGLNGCLYYNYNGDGTAVVGDASNPIGNSVASCLNKFEGGTGCVYYGDQAASTSRVNCLPGTDFTKLKSKAAPAGIPTGCVVMDKGNGRKEYDCSGVNGCYYYLNGTVDCDYTMMDSSIPPANIGLGCVYEPNPAGAQMCPRAFKAPAGGVDFLQCLLNPDAVLPSFLLGSGTSELSACRTSADCPVDAPVCIDGTCYPVCQNDISCVAGESCLQTCDPITDPCTGELLCINNVCVNPPPLNPSTFSCLDITADRQLDYDTSSADIAVRSSQNASCRWSLFDISFASMTNSFGTGDSLNHTATVVGLPDAGLATIFTQCDNGAGKTATCNVNLSIGQTCDSATSPCPSGMECQNGWCVAPTCANAQPLGTLPFETLASGTLISMTTTLNSNCVYSNSYDNTSQCVAPILDCTTATPFTTTGGIDHSSFLTAPPLVVGNDTQFVKCQEIESPQNKLSDTCKIPFNIGTCWTDSDCKNNWTCETVGNFGPGVCIPPACSGAYPSGKLSYTATSTDFGLTTNATSTCAYSANYTDPYSAMTAFTETGGLAHFSNMAVTRNSDVYKYVICQETATGTTTPVCTIHFKVGDLLPICAGAYPTGRYDVGATPTIGLTTNQSAVCKFADTYDNLVTPEERYNNMANTFRRTVDGLTHGTDGSFQDIVTVVQGDNTKYVACQETAVPNKITECRIPFRGGSSCTGTLGECEFGSVCNPIAGDCENPCESSEPPDWCFKDTLPPPCPPFCPTSPPAPSSEASCNTLGYEFFNNAVRPSGNCSLVAIILALLSWLAWVVALLAVLSGLRAAYLYITSAGDEKKLRLAYHYLIYTTIGVGVAILTFSIVAITRAILNI